MAVEETAAAAATPAATVTAGGTMTVIVAAMTTAVATEAGTAASDDGRVFWQRGSQRCAGMSRVSEVAIKLHKPFGDFICQQGAMFLTLS